ncbi:MAG: HAMP domain-containing histidine kinase [Clostridia bacterium]|nr:HAMP domain-containing histidine kinase [Clostridia bacterium]
MEHLLLMIIGILLLLLFALLAKVYFLRKAAREIAEAFRDRLAADTNILIDISTRDPHMRKLAADINKQLRLLRRERHRYQQGDLELKEAVTNISHDLRTPLTAISGYLDLLDREEKSETVRRYLAQIRNRTSALTTLTGELLQYSVVASAPNLHMQRMDVAKALEESLLSFYAVMQEKGIEPRIELPEEPVFRELDAGAVSRIFSNIIGNALKYTDGDLSVSMDADGCITFANTASRLNAVSVGRLFDRFFTVEAARSSTGLGRSIARTLTEQLGGSIRAAYDGGTLRIIVCFPQ